MAKKNIKCGVKTPKTNYQKLPTNAETINDPKAKKSCEESNDGAGTTREIKITMLNTNERKNHDGNKSMTSKLENDVPLTLPQCFQYRLLLTFLHVIRALLGYFLMLSVMTYNWWIFIVVLSGSVIGYLIFGWGNMHTLDVMAASTLPPQVVAKSTLEDELESNERARLHRHQDLEADAATRENRETENLWNSELEIPGENPPKYSESSDPEFQKVDIRINLQGDVIPESEFTKRLEKSKETDL